MALSKKTKEQLDKVYSADLLMKMPVPYEPMKKNRWLIRFDSELNIQPWLLASASRPNYKRIISKSWWDKIRGYGDQLLLEDMKLVLRDPIGEDLGGSLLKVFENTTKFGFKLEMLDPTGVVVETWEITDSIIMGLDFGELTYMDEGVADITVIIRPGSVKLL